MKNELLLKWMGYKGATFVVATVALWAGKMDCAMWVTVALSLCGMRIGRDIMSKPKRSRK